MCPAYAYMQEQLLSVMSASSAVNMVTGRKIWMAVTDCRRNLS